jgi:hypothetical protein
MRSSGNPEVVTENPRVGSSILSLVTLMEKLQRNFSGAFSLGYAMGLIRFILAPKWAV